MLGSPGKDLLKLGSATLVQQFQSGNLESTSQAFRFLGLIY